MKVSAIYSVFLAVGLLIFTQADLYVLGRPFIAIGDASLLIGALFGLWLHFFEPVHLIVDVIPRIQTNQRNQIVPKDREDDQNFWRLAA